MNIGTSKYETFPKIISARFLKSNPRLTKSISNILTNHANGTARQNSGNRTLPSL